MILNTSTKKNNRIRRVFSNIKIRTRKQTINKFANKYGLVYFGAVDQHSDDYKVVRGFTVSSTHNDNHYCVGSINGYDVTLVNRSDAIWRDNKSLALCDWLIITINLHASINVPHFFIQANNHDVQPYAALFSSFPNMKDINSNLLDKQTSEFTSRFKIYARPTKIHEINKFFPSETTQTLGVNFWPLSIEQHDNILYIYSVNTKITSSLLDNMIKNGLWLAENIDLHAENLQN